MKHAGGREERAELEGEKRSAAGTSWGGEGNGVGGEIKSRSREQARARVGHRRERIEGSVFNC